MGGWKTWAAGGASILTGVAMIAKDLAEGTLSMDHIQSAIAFISGGLGLIGIGHKIERVGK